jgi:hypothetical protein
VPLPWLRQWGFARSWQEDLYLGGLLRHTLLGMIPCVVVGLVGARWRRARQRERQRAQGVSEAELTARLRLERRRSRVALGLALLAALSLFAAGAAWLAVDAADLAPEESYYWPGWYLFAGLAWGLSYFVLCWLVGAALSVRRVWMRRFGGSRHNRGARVDPEPAHDPIPAGRASSDPITP